MIKKLIVKALKLKYKFHHYYGDLYLDRINNSNTDMNDKYWAKLKFHANKERKIVDRLYQIEGI